MANFNDATKEIIRQNIDRILNRWDNNDIHYKSFSYPLFYTKNNQTLTQPIHGSKYSEIVMQDSQNPFRFVAGFYPDLNKDPRVHKKVAKYYYYKLLDKWLYHDLKHLLAYITIQDGRPALIKSLNQYDFNSVNDLSTEELKKRIDFLENNIITKDLIKHYLKKIVNKKKIMWYHLNKFEDTIKDKFKNYLTKTIESHIKN